MKKAILGLILFFCHTIAFAEVSVNVNRKSVGINESFKVEFSSDQKMNEHPDFAPLESDFEILSNSQGYSTSIINGVINQKSTWQLELIPRHEGQLILPAIKFGKSTSQPVVIDVTPAKLTQQDDSLYLEAEVNPSTGSYEQTQLIYTLRLIRSVNIAQAALSEVKVSDPDALIEKIGDDIEYEKMLNNGKQTIVLERKYAVFPQHAGELVFSPVNFEGKILVGGNSFFNQQTQFKRASSNEVKVEIKPIPAPFQKYNWFAANEVALVEEWSADPSKLTLGEPITWTLTLTADGCLGSQIPPVSIHLPSELKQYEDKPEISNKAKGDGYVGIRQTKIALIANKAGTLTLPEIVVKWWDLKADKMRETQLPSRTIHVEGGAVALNSSLEKQEEESVNTQQPIPENPAASHDLPLWAWALIGLNVIWIIGLGYFAFKKFGFKATPKADSLGQIKSRLKIACKEHDAKQSEALLLSWAALVNPQDKPQTLIGMKERLPEDFQESIDELYQALYGRQKNWQGDALWQAFAAYKLPNPKKTAVKKTEHLLKNLYS